MMAQIYPNKTSNHRNGNEGSHSHTHQRRNHHHQQHHRHRHPSPINGKSSSNNCKPLTTCDKVTNNKNTNSKHQHQHHHHHRRSSSEKRRRSSDVDELGAGATDSTAGCPSAMNRLRGGGLGCEDGEEQRNVNVRDRHNNPVACHNGGVNNDVNKNSGRGNNITTSTQPQQQQQPRRSVVGRLLASTSGNNNGSFSKKKNDILDDPPFIQPPSAGAPPSKPQVEAHQKEAIATAAAEATTGTGTTTTTAKKESNLTKGKTSSGLGGSGGKHVRIQEPVMSSRSSSNTNQRQYHYEYEDALSCFSTRTEEQHQRLIQCFQDEIQKLLKRNKRLEVKLRLGQKQQDTARQEAMDAVQRATEQSLTIITLKEENVNLHKRVALLEYELSQKQQQQEKEDEEQHLHQHDMNKTSQDSGTSSEQNPSQVSFDEDQTDDRDVRLKDQDNFFKRGQGKIDTFQVNEHYDNQDEDDQHCYDHHNYDDNVYYQDQDEYEEPEQYNDNVGNDDCHYDNYDDDDAEQHCRPIYGIASDDRFYDEPPVRSARHDDDNDDDDAFAAARVSRQCSSQSRTRPLVRRHSHSGESSVHMIDDEHPYDNDDEHYYDEDDYFDHHCKTSKRTTEQSRHHQHHHGHHPRDESPRRSRGATTGASPRKPRTNDTTTFSQRKSVDHTTKDMSPQGAARPALRRARTYSMNENNNKNSSSFTNGDTNNNDLPPRPPFTVSANANGTTKGGSPHSPSPRSKRPLLTKHNNNHNSWTGTSSRQMLVEAQNLVREGLGVTTTSGGTTSKDRTGNSNPCGGGGGGIRRDSQVTATTSSNTSSSGHSPSPLPSPLPDGAAALISLSEPTSLQLPPAPPLETDRFHESTRGKSIRASITNAKLTDKREDYDYNMNQEEDFVVNHATHLGVDNTTTAENGTNNVHQTRFSLLKQAGTKFLGRGGGHHNGAENSFNKDSGGGAPSSPSKNKSGEDNLRKTICIDRPASRALHQWLEKQDRKETTTARSWDQSGNTKNNHQASDQQFYSYRHSNNNGNTTANNNNDLLNVIPEEDAGGNTLKKTRTPTPVSYFPTKSPMMKTLPKSLRGVGNSSGGNGSSSPYESRKKISSFRRAYAASPSKTRTTPAA